MFGVGSTSAPLCTEELLDKTAPEPPRRFTTAVTYQLVIYIRVASVAFLV